MSTRCRARRPPTGETTDSWIRPHVCRWPHQHDGYPHECTCGFAWNTTEATTVETH